MVAVLSESGPEVKGGGRLSTLYALLRQGHHDVKVSPEEWHRIAVWLDAMSTFCGVYEMEGGLATHRGEIIQPTLE